MRLILLDKVTAMVGSLHSGNILAAAPILEQYKIPTVGAGTSPTWLEQGYKYLFRAIGNSELSVKELARYAATTDIKRVSIIQSDDEYGRIGAKLFIEHAQKHDIEILANESFTHGDRDFTGQFARILKGNPQAVFVWALGDDLGSVTKQLRQIGYDGLILGAEGYTLPQVLKVAGSAANNVVFAAQYLLYDTPEEAQDPLLRSFLKRYIDKHGQRPVSDNAYRGYDSVMIIAEAIRRAGNLNTQQIREQISEIENFEGLAGNFTYKGHQGEGIHHMTFFKITNGRYKEIKEQGQ
jgi:branched-chain amino acid transport system substrate-binding protein